MTINGNIIDHEAIRRYIEKCFIDSFKAEDRQYNEKHWNFKYVLIKSNKNKIYLVPLIIWCRYLRVERRVTYRLSNNLEKNFGVIYSRDDDMRTNVYETGTIDVNFTEFMFKVDNKQVSLSIYDEFTENYESGEVIPAWRYEKLIFAKYGITKDEFREGMGLDVDMKWPEFKELYSKAFDYPLGRDYEVECGLGVERI